MRRRAGSPTSHCGLEIEECRSGNGIGIEIRIGISPLFALCASILRMTAMEDRLVQVLVSIDSCELALIRVKAASRHQ